MHAGRCSSSMEKDLWVRGAGEVKERVKRGVREGERGRSERGGGAGKGRARCQK